MPATTPVINLLGQEDISRSPGGRIIAWALTYGRYIMVGTEIIVLLAFISRFSLDRKLTDLKEEIAQKQAILLANAPLEADIRVVQDQIIKIKTLLKDQTKPVDTFRMVTSILPQDSYLQTLEITSEKFSADVVSGTTDGFGQFLTNAQSVKQIAKIDIGEVKKNPLSGLEFKITATLASDTKKIQ